jgi:hypothetical protein
VRDQCRCFSGPRGCPYHEIGIRFKVIEGLEIIFFPGADPISLLLVT